MSDVELGGATAFPKLHLRIAPSKGAAAYWWNLKKSGQGDLRTRHAGCPVLVGSKWGMLIMIVIMIMITLLLNYYIVILI